MAEKRKDTNACQKLPAGHFNSDGVSQGKQTGAVRPTPDAYNDMKPAQKQADPSPRKPAN